MTSGSSAAAASGVLFARAAGIRTRGFPYPRKKKSGRWERPLRGGRTGEDWVTQVVVDRPDSLLPLLGGIQASSRTPHVEVHELPVRVVAREVADQGVVPLPEGQRHALDGTRLDLFDLTHGARFRRLRCTRRGEVP